MNDFDAELAKDIANDAAEWRVIPWAADYAVSSDGRVRRETHSRTMKAGTEKRRSPDKDGYLSVGVTIDGRETRCRVNRLVCEAFHGPAPSPEHHAAHRNGIRTDNRASNLRWATPADNCADKLEHGTVQRGERNWRARLTEQAVREIRAAVPRRGYRGELARKFGVSPMAISMVRGGFIWKHVA